MMMMTTLKEIVTTSQAETRALVMDILQGRQQPTTGTTETTRTPDEQPTSFDYDSTPLPGGIEAILERENEESAQVLLLRERRELHERLAQAQADLRSQGIFDDSWSSPSEPQPPDATPPPQM